MKQLALDLPHRAAMGAEDFIVTGGNRAAVHAIDSWPDWPERIIVLHGAAGAGKTHLARVWGTTSGARFAAGAALAETIENLLAEKTVIIDDIDAVAGDAAAEQALFHLCNHIRAHGHMLLTAGRPPAQLGIQLPDLRSRLLSYPAAEILPPDDDLLAALLIKHFNDRQLRVPQEVVDFLLPRMERSADAALRIVAALDAAALARKTAITVPLARQVMA